MIPLMVLTAALAWMGVQGTGRRVCYYTNYSQYRPGIGKYIPENINATLCTHIAIAFGKISYNTLGPYEWNDESSPYRKGTFEKIVNLKNTNPDLKVLLSVGGWNAHSEPFNIILQSQHKTNIFANKAAKYLRLKGMDGLDVDWEYPTNKEKYNILIKTLKDAFIAEADDSGRERLLLTSAVPAGKSKIDSGYDVPFVAEIMDFITVMTYDLHGSWEQVTGHHTAMYAGPWETGVQRYFNVEWIMNYWHQLGVPKSKLNLGLATYGRCFTLQSASQNRVNERSTGPSIAGKYTREKGFLSYYEICVMLQQGAVKKYISDQKVPYLVKGDQWCGFDDILSIKMKVQYGKSEGFGGIAVWSMDLDDFNGLCDQKYPLMTTIFEEMRSNAPFVGPTSPEKETSTTYKKYSRKLTSDVWKDWITTTTMKPLTTEMKTTRPTTNSDPCFGRYGGIMPDANDCQKFWMCFNGKGYVQPCPEYLLWNRVTNVCDWAANVICSPSSQI